MLQHLLVWSVVTAQSLCNMLQLFFVDLHTIGASFALQFHILPLEEAVCNFWPFLLLPQWYIWSVLWTSTWIFNFLFDSIVKDRHEIEKLQWVSTKHIYIYFWSRLLIHKLAHHFCHINIIISPQIICMLLTLDALDFHGISIMIIVMYGIIVFLQCITSVLV